MDTLEDQLANRLHAIDEVVLPVGDPSGDVRRGRQRLRRRRVLATVGSAAAVAVLVGGVAGLAQVLPLSAGGEDAPLAPLTQPAKPPAIAAVPGCSPVVDPGQESRGIDPADARRLDGYRDAVARHLDPAGQHLETGTISNIQSSRVAGNCPAGQVRYDALGTKLGWSVAGRPGLGMVQVEVNAPGPGTSQVEAGVDGWQPHPTTLPGVRSLQVARGTTRLGVLLTREDGTRVGLLADDLFGNNSLVPQKVDVDLDAMIAAAADPALTLP